jgi:hypothetical protein
LIKGRKLKEKDWKKLKKKWINQNVKIN